MPRNLVDAILRQQQQTNSTMQLRAMQRGRVVLGGSSGSGGGSGGPPGGFVGKLIQSRVCYDTTEAASSSGTTSLVDNLNHIRQDVVDIESNYLTNSSGSSTDNAIVRWDGSSGSIAQNSGVLIDDDDNITIPGQVTVIGDADTEQLVVRAHSTQTDPLIQLQSSGSTPLMDIHSNIDTNLFIGVGAGVNTIPGVAPAGQHNIFIGKNAGNATIVGYGNIGIGFRALENNLDSVGIAIGYQALQSNTTGLGNVAIGYEALLNNTTGGPNYALGREALESNISGSNNVAIGPYALRNNTEGLYNLAIGQNALYDVTTGDYNTAIGGLAGSNTSGSSTSNVFIGYRAGEDEAGSNKLYIANSDTSTPLIYGEFDNDLLRIHGLLEARDASEQFRVAYDADSYVSFTTDSTSTLTIAPAESGVVIMSSDLSVADNDITNVGDIALDTISADDGSSFAISNDWTNAGNTIADLGTVTTVDINGGTVDGITSLTVVNDVDIGAYDLRAATLTADGLTSGRVVIASTNGKLSDDGDLTFAVDTLTVTKIAAFELTGKLTAGATEIEGSAFDIDGGDISTATISGGLTWNAAQNLNNQNLTNVDIDSGDISSVTISGDLAWGAAQGFDGQNLSNIGTLDTTGRITSTVTTEQLRLAYDADSYASFTVASDSDLTIKPAETGQVIIQPTTDSTTFFQVLDDDSGTPILNVDSTNERVGICMVNPSYELDVTGDASVSGVLHTTEVRALSSAGLKLYNDAGDAGIFVKDDGNVGMGTAAPGRRLVVNTNDGAEYNALGDLGTPGMVVADGAALTGLRLIGTSEGFMQFHTTNADKGWYMRGHEGQDAFQIGQDHAVAQNLITLKSGGNLAVGPSLLNPTAQLHVDQASATGAKPVLTLDQADVSEEFIEFIGTIAAGNSLEAVGGKTLTTTHFIKVKLPGGLIRYTPCGTIA